MEPQEVAGKEFPVALRGSAREEVHAFLAAAAAELAERDARIRALEAELARLRDDRDRRPAPVPAGVDRAALIERLGEETASILAAGDEAARRVEERVGSTVAGLRRDLRAVAENLRSTYDRLGDVLSVVSSLPGPDAPAEIRLPDRDAGVESPSPGSWLR